MIQEIKNIFVKIPVFGRMGPVVSIWNEFHRPPYGGGNQFLLALKKELRRLGVRVVINDASPYVDVHLCNSAWFDVDKLRRLSASNQLRMVHRLDGSISIARGIEDTSEDNKIYALNEELASATIYQSQWCYRQAENLGFHAIAPVIIRNAVDRSIFHSHGRKSYDPTRKIRLITTSWSDNLRKGAAIYNWLDGHLDWSRYEYTFVGRIKETFSHIHHVAPVGSEELAGILRQHDIFVTATQKDACSNAIIEALACGLPVVCLNDGGSPELVRAGGKCFKDVSNLLLCLDEVVKHYSAYQESIQLNDITTVAQCYLDVIHRVMLQSPKVA